MCNKLDVFLLELGVRFKVAVQNVTVVVSHLLTVKKMRPCKWGMCLFIQSSVFCEMGENYCKLERSQ